MKFYVYVIQATSGPCKIGLTKSLSRRLDALRCANFDDLTVVHSIECEDQNAAVLVERDLHKQYKHRHIRGEWFKLTKSDIATITGTKHKRTKKIGPIPWGNILVNKGEG